MRVIRPPLAERLPAPYRYWSAIRVAYGRPDMHYHEVRLDHDFEPPPG